MPAAGFVGAPAPAPDPAELVTPPGMARRSFAAMGTTVTVVLDERHDGGVALVAALFESWEQTFSRFRPTSELSRVNARSGRSVTVSPRFAEVVAAALDAARATDGIFDPGLERQLRAHGYDRTFAEVPPDRPASTVEVHPGGGWREIELDRAARTLRLPRGLHLDLGGIAKGLAVDAAVAELARLGAGPAAVEAGGDAGVLGLPAGSEGWPIRLEVPSGERVVELPSGAVATSGISRRAWRVGGQQRHHLLDPRTGQPTANGLWSVTAFAATCGQAEVAAKTAFVLGPARGARFLLRIGVAGLMVALDGAQTIVGTWAAPPSQSDAADRPAGPGAATPPPTGRARRPLAAASS